MSCWVFFGKKSLLSLFKKINYWRYIQQLISMKYIYGFTTKRCSREKLFPYLISEKSKNKALASYKIFLGNINPVKSVYSIKIFISLNISRFIFFSNDLYVRNMTNSKQLLKLGPLNVSQSAFLGPLNVRWNTKYF